MASIISQKNIFSVLDADSLDNTQVLCSTNTRVIDPALFEYETIPLVKDDKVFLSDQKNKRTRKLKPDKIVCSTSYLENKNISNRDLYNQQTNENSIRSDDVAVALKYSKACNNVITKTADGLFGTCYRPECTFAHSLEEWQPPKCQFDSECRLFYGRKNKDGVVDNTTKCKFLHSSESITYWMKRTGQTTPVLPPTNEYSRKPKVSTKNITIQKVTNNEIVVTNSKSELPIWGITTPNIKKESLPESPKQVESLSKNNVKSYSNSDDPRTCDTSLRKSKKYHIHIIRVPTKDLAEIAIKTALEKGIFNIQVELI